MRIRGEVLDFSRSNHQNTLGNIRVKITDLDDPNYLDVKSVPVSRSEASSTGDLQTLVQAIVEETLRQLEVELAEQQGGQTVDIESAVQAAKNRGLHSAAAWVETGSGRVRKP